MIFSPSAPHLSWAQLFIYRNSDKYGSVFAYLLVYHYFSTTLSTTLSTNSALTTSLLLRPFVISTQRSRTAVGMKWELSCITVISFCACNYLWIVCCWSFPCNWVTHKFYCIGSSYLLNRFMCSREKLFLACARLLMHCATHSRD